VSGIDQGTEFDVAAATAGQGHSGVAHDELLTALVDAALGDDDAALRTARQRLVETLGYDALVETAATIGTFQQMTRIADGTGIPLDGPLDMATQDLREEIGATRFGSSANTPAMGGLQRMLGRTFARWMRPLQPKLVRLLARRNDFSARKR